MHIVKTCNKKLSIVQPACTIIPRLQKNQAGSYRMLSYRGLSKYKLKKLDVVKKFFSTEEVRDRKEVCIRLAYRKTLWVLIHSYKFLLPFSLSNFPSLDTQSSLFILLICLVFWFLRQSHYVALAVLKFTM